MMTTKKRSRACHRTCQHVRVSRVPVFLRKGGFHLRKWASNRVDILATLPRPEVCETGEKELGKALGVYWLKDEDVITFMPPAKSTTQSRTTKRQLLSLATLHLCFELVCKLRDISDAASVIPLRLTGGAFAVYLQLNAQDRSSIDKFKEALLAAFAADRFVDYDQFVSRKLGPDESPDVFLAELRRLATLFGRVSEKALACAFVAGLPENVCQLLMAGSRMEDLGLSQILTRARAIITDERPVDAPNTCLSARGPGVRSPTAPPGQRCFECGGPNHFARDCLAGRQDGNPATYCPSTRSFPPRGNGQTPGSPASRKIR
ncbi:hypothetical protein T03_10195 [Trichinella britovi]|uniref:CCHC-type domain-containing protein n=1 Tax=Trichinella britovi TaxID=45882 RepID=A0A0V1C7P5_TRIBR|nr:hypothetical protein T03_10195 [Trichinella britovi]